MRWAPLEDPTLSRGQALSQALAKQLALLFLTVSQKACFAHFADAAQQHGLHLRRLPDGLLAVSCFTHSSHSVAQHSFLVHDHAALTHCTQTGWHSIFVRSHSLASQAVL